MGRRRRIESGALLTGLIFDDRGNRMSPSYTVRRGSRYRYYIVQAALRRGAEAGSRTCVAADEIERLVVETLGRAFARNDLNAGASGWSGETRVLLHETIERVVVHAHDIDIMLKPATSTRSAQAMDIEQPDDIAVGAPVVFKASLPPPP